MVKNGINIDQEKELVSIQDGAKKQYFIVLFLCVITTFNGVVLSFNPTAEFISKLGIVLAILGLVMAGFIFRKLNYQEELHFSEIDNFFIKKSFGKEQPVFKLKNGKIRRIFIPISDDIKQTLTAKFGK